MDSSTAEFYAHNAQDVAQRFESAKSTVARYFAAAFPEGSRVLDVGAGSGRDLAELITRGYDAYGIEPVEALAAEAIGHHPQLRGRIQPGELPMIGDPFGGKFDDGILCSAVLMHIPDATCSTLPSHCDTCFDLTVGCSRRSRCHARISRSASAMHMGGCSRPTPPNTCRSCSSGSASSRSAVGTATTRWPAPARAGTR